MEHYAKFDVHAAQQHVAPAVLGFFRSVALGQASGTKGSPLPFGCPFSCIRCLSATYAAFQPHMLPFSHIHCLSATCTPFQPHTLLFSHIHCLSATLLPVATSCPTRSLPAAHQLLALGEILAMATSCCSVCLSANIVKMQVTFRILPVPQIEGLPVYLVGVLLTSSEGQLMHQHHRH